MQQVKSKNWLWIIGLLIFLVIICVIYFITKPTSTNKNILNVNQPALNNTQTENINIENKNIATVNSQPSTNQPSTISKLLEPVDGFLQRITKKPFGIYITPATSPVQPERFTGYHTGADAEFTPTPLQNAMYVNPRIKNFVEGAKPWINVSVTMAKRETDKAIPVKVWGFTDMQGKVVEVKAIAPGIVVVSRTASGYGGVLVIKHDINSQ